MQKHQKKDLRFQLIVDKIVLLKMKLNHPSISTGQGNQLVPLLPVVPMEKAFMDMVDEY